MFAPSKRTLTQFLATDPETFPLLTILGLTVGAAGYSLGDKRVRDENNVLVARGGQPWKSTDPNANYKYLFYKHGNPNAPVLQAPNAINEVTAEVHLPASQIPKYMT